MIIADASAIFANASDFAEPVTYYPKSGSSRLIDVVVMRDALAVLPMDGDNETPVFEVHVTNDSTLGISSDELKEGVDQLSFSVRVGQSATRRTITRLISHDEGMLVLECR